MTETINLQGQPPAGTKCQEASALSRQYYIPCGQPAAFYVKTRDPMPYAMCEACADHNVRNRGAKIVATGRVEGE